MQAAPRCRVSALILAQDHQRSIAAALQSALDQTQPDVEVVVLDNGSLDATASIAAELCEGSGGRARLLLQPRSHDAAAANRLLRAARGDCVAFLQARDVWAADKLRRQLGTLGTQPQLQAVFGWAAYGPSGCPQEGSYSPAGNLRGEPRAWLGTLLLQPAAVSWSSCLLPRSRVQEVGPFAEDLEHAWFYDYVLRLLAQGSVACVPAPLLTAGPPLPGATASRPQARHREIWQVLGKRAPAVLQRHPFLGGMLGPLYDTLCAHAYAAENWSAAEKYYRAKQQTGGLEADDIVRFVDCLLHQINFKEANDVLEQLFAQRHRLPPSTRAMMHELVRRVVGFGDGSLDPYEAARGLGTPAGRFEAERLRPVGEAF